MQREDEAREQLRHLLRVTRLASLSLFSSLRISYSHMLQAERDIKARLEVELSGSKIQSKMLSDMVSRASLTSSHEDDEALPDSERNKLLADKRFLRQRVRDAEMQVARLETELRALRPLLLRHDDEPSSLPSTPRSRQARRRREAVMGDATSEHLLLATRMLRTLRRATRPGVTSPYDSSPPKTDPVTLRRMMPTTPNSAPTRAADLSFTPRSHASGIDDLLHAAQSLGGGETPGARWHASEASTSTANPSPSRTWAANPPASAPVFGSPKRRRVSPGAMDVDSAGGGDGWHSPERGLSSALDMLADQAASEHADRSPPKLFTPHHPTQSGSAPFDRSDWAATATGALSQRAPPNSAPRPRAGGNQSPEKRLPYVRWSAEEDTKLRSAIKEHGQRWEHVARAVGTRSYHQCRQRYLLMRRKEAAANGLASPSKNTPRTPTRPPEESVSSTSDGDPDARASALSTPTKASAPHVGRDSLMHATPHGYVRGPVVYS